MSIHWSIEEKTLDLAYTWKISRNASNHKNNFFVSISDGKTGSMGEAAPNIRYDETPEKIRSEFNTFLENGASQITRLEELESILSTLNFCNSLRFAIESAYIHYLCNKNNQSIYQFLNITPPSTIHTSYTIPIMEVGSVKSFIYEHSLQRFHSLKIKINDDGMDLINECCRHYKGPLRIDANEAWKDVDALIRFIENLKGKNVEFVEQPLPYQCEEEYIHLKKHSSLPIIGDESITNSADFESLKKQFHGVNMKLMKAGGYINGRDILLNAKKNGMLTMIGCMVETSLGISSGMHLCALTDYVDLDGSFVIANEPFDLIKESNGNLNFI